MSNGSRGIWKHIKCVGIRNTKTNKARGVSYDRDDNKRNRYDMCGYDRAAADVRQDQYGSALCAVAGSGTAAASAVSLRQQSVQHHERSRADKAVL